jgi:hypothetical protein
VRIPRAGFFTNIRLTGIADINHRIPTAAPLDHHLTGNFVSVSSELLQLFTQGRRGAALPDRATVFRYLIVMGHRINESLPLSDGLHHGS